MTACATTPNKQFHVFYEPYYVYQLYFDGTKWSSENFGIYPSGQGGMSSFAIGNLQHVFYLGQ